MPGVFKQHRSRCLLVIRLERQPRQQSHCHLLVFSAWRVIAHACSKCYFTTEPLVTGSHGIGPDSICTSLPLTLEHRLSDQYPTLEFLSNWVLSLPGPQDSMIVQQENSGPVSFVVVLRRRHDLRYLHDLQNWVH